MSHIFDSDLAFSDKMFFISKNILVNNKIVNIQDKIQLKGINGQPHFLDKYEGIDGYIIINNNKYTVQEKIRRYNNYKYNDFTLEYMSNVVNNEEGEFFHLNAMYYIHGYSNKNENGIIELRILYIPKIMDYVKKNIEYLIKNNIRYNIKHSKASFFVISLSTLDNIGATKCLINSKGIKYFN